jgi:putative membrane protein
MVEQHTAAKQKGTQLAAQSGIQPAESPKAKELQANGTATLQQLKAAEGKDFDVAYFHAQVDQHATVLRLIEEHLQPAAKDAALRDHLTEARAMVSQHLDHAKQLQQ